MAHRRGNDDIIRNRRFVAMLLVAVVVLGVSWLLRPERTGRPAASVAGGSPAGRTAVGAPSVGPGRGGLPQSAPEGGAGSAAASHSPSARTGLRVLARRTDAAAPASVTVGGSGLVAVPTSSGGHDVVLFRADGSVAGRVADTVELNRYRISGHQGVVRGSPAAAVIAPDGRHVYVTNEAMSGDGFRPQPTSCGPGGAVQPGYVYRLEVSTLTVDQVIPVGPRPGPITMTPDGRQVLVTHACSGELGVISTERAARVATVQLDGPATAVAMSPDGRVGYATVPTRNAVVAVDLATVMGGVAQAQTLATVPGAPAALTVSPDGRHVFVASGAVGTAGAAGSAGSAAVTGLAARTTGSGSIAKLDSTSGAVLARVNTRSRARALVVSADGTAVFATVDAPSAVTKLTADDLHAATELTTPPDPVGLAYDASAGRLWVACRTGSVLVVDDTGPITARSRSAG